eukprot:gb/GFBE01001600.1/.p1 GENE.gb/GFBE01001600.1/~~gb/GFBE01001600.1/.p1  ORF type:complete len:225 (+),score=52.15 gb/GFBE01001600.1/:1-675(+)
MSRFAAVLGSVLGAMLALSWSSRSAPSTGFSFPRRTQSRQTSIGSPMLVSKLTAGRHDARMPLLARASNGITYGLLMPAAGSFPEDVYAATQRERDDIISALGEDDLLFEKQLHELPRASMLAQQLVQVYDVDVIICVHPIEYTPLSDESENTALGRQFFRVREAFKTTAKLMNVPMLMHPAVCDCNFLQVMKDSNYFKDVTKATVDDAKLLAQAHKEAAEKKR